MMAVQTRREEAIREFRNGYSTVESSRAAYDGQLQYFTISDWSTYIRILIRRLKAEKDEDQKKLIMRRLEMSLM